MHDWRLARPADDDAIVSMSLALYEEDPPKRSVSADHVRHTLAVLRAEPTRGRVLVLHDGDDVAGYALLISFWSNELGGEICTVDELYVKPALRNRRHGTSLVQRLISAATLWPRRPVALELEVSPENRALKLYERLGFRIKRNATMRLAAEDMQQ